MTGSVSARDESNPPLGITRCLFARHQKSLAHEQFKRFKDFLVVFGGKTLKKMFCKHSKFAVRYLQNEKASINDSICKDVLLT